MLWYNHKCYITSVIYRSDIMPPKTKITKEMIIAAGLKIVRSEGEGALNVRRIAAELECSTQPVMYHYKNVEELRADIFSAADRLHEEYISQKPEGETDPFLSMGLRYIRFAYEEKHLFRFLFQSDKYKSTGLTQLLEQPEAEFLLRPICEETGLSRDKAKEVFEGLFMCVHGAASFIADNSVEYDEGHYKAILSNVFFGMIGMMLRGDSNEKDI